MTSYDTYDIIDTIKRESIRVATRLGPCFTEACYKKLLVHYLEDAGIICVVEKPINIYIDGFLITTKKEDLYIPKINLVIELKCYSNTKLDEKSSAHQQLTYYMQEDEDKPTHGMIIVFRSVKDQQPLKSNTFPNYKPAFYFINTSNIDNTEQQGREKNDHTSNQEPKDCQCAGSVSD